MAEGANLFAGDWDFTHGGVGMAGLGRRLGAELLGATVYELQPGSRWADLHLHHANEEMIFVLAGRPTLRTLDGERDLVPGEVVACPTGRRGAHRLDNRADEPARVLIVSTKISPELVEYPDSGKVGAMSQPPGEQPVRVMTRPEDSLDYFEGEL